MILTRRLPLFCAALLLVGCFLDPDVSQPGEETLALGTWGGKNAGLIVEDTLAHVHVGCTYGNFSGPRQLDNAGLFDVAGEYLLRAYPIAVGPTQPARFTGTVQGNKLTMTVTVNDTTEKKTVVLGPVTVTFKETPHLGPCPICRTPKAIRQSLMRASVNAVGHRAHVARPGTER